MPWSNNKASQTALLTLAFESLFYLCHCSVSGSSLSSNKQHLFTVPWVHFSLLPWYVGSLIFLQVYPNYNWTGTICTTYPQSLAPALLCQQFHPMNPKVKIKCSDCYFCLLFFKILFVVNAYQFLKGQFMTNFTTKNFLICLFLLISSIRIPGSFSWCMDLGLVREK